MSLDGIILNSLKQEFEANLLNARVEKVYQPETDELTILLRSSTSNHKLLLSANSKYPRIHLTNFDKNNPDSAPLFCMMLRKHITGGKIIKFNQPSLERILEIYIEVLDDFRDLSIRKLIIEIMGKHSNIILTDENDTIIDSIKHITENISSVRTIMPKQTYVYPPSQNKLNPLEVTQEHFINTIRISDQTETIQKFVYMNFVGLSPQFASDICERSHVKSEFLLKDLDSVQILNIYRHFSEQINLVRENKYSCYIQNDLKGRPIDFYCIPVLDEEGYKIVKYNTPSLMLDKYYSEKDKIDRLKQKYSDIKKLLENLLDKNEKKKILQLKSLHDTDNSDEYKLKGDLIISYIYMIKKGMKDIEVVNFYSENEEIIKILLDKDLTPSENAQKYFNRYNKMKRTRDAASSQLSEVKDEISYLESLLASLEAVENEADILEIKEELYEGKYIKHPQTKSKKHNIKSEPLHYVSSDGFDIFVGKNNYQNDNLTMKIANSNDIWFHTKDIPGSHVIVKAKNQEVPDVTLYEAAMLAAYYSKAKGSSNIAVDYTEKKNVKKPSGAKPGFVIYLTNKTKYVTPDEEEINKLAKK